MSHIGPARELRELVSWAFSRMIPRCTLCRRDTNRARMEIAMLLENRLLLLRCVCTKNVRCHRGKNVHACGLCKQASLCFVLFVPLAHGISKCGVALSRGETNYLYKNLLETTFAGEGGFKSIARRLSRCCTKTAARDAGEKTVGLWAKTKMIPIEFNLNLI